jgi:hydroxyethylthiazole kinase-like uncharacterized protein yjeF
MQTLLSSEQMHKADAYAIANLPISPIDLMEQAALAFVKIFKGEVKDKQTSISILCGTGNNGADGLAIARLLTKGNYKNIQVYVFHFSTKQTEEFAKNWKRLSKMDVPVQEINELDTLQLSSGVIIDAILGTGLNKPLNGKYAGIAKVINASDGRIIAVDVPTGFPTEGPIDENYKGVKADLVISFQRPKINFFLPESARAINRFEIVDIGLDEAYIESQESYWKLTTTDDILHIFKPRANFSHKGTFGHALLVAGNTNTMGAALLMAKACLHAGAGLTTLCLPKSGLKTLNTLLPEVMALPRSEHVDLEDFSKYNAIGVGPGLGLSTKNEHWIAHLIGLKRPLVIDADGITLLSKQKGLLKKLPAGSILTPHLKEFDRIFGTHSNWLERIQTARNAAQNGNIIIVLKNQWTFVCLPSGEVRINPTGNPAMASGGMGDVLTGMITAYMAQNYSSADAAILATFLHGKTGDFLAKKSIIVTAGEVAGEVSKMMSKLLR